MDNNVVLAEQFLHKCIRGGLAYSYDVVRKRWVKPYPEVTGYLLSYFTAEAENDNLPSSILEAADRLVETQDPSGGFRSFMNTHVLYTFDTAQIMHGLASLSKSSNTHSLQRAVKCAEFVCDMQLPDGSMFPMYDLRYCAKYVDKKGDWGSNFSYIQVKNIEGLMLLFELTGASHYRHVAENLAAFGKSNCDLTFTHPGAYCLEGLVAIGEIQFVREQLRKEIVPRIQKNGFLAYASELPYAYVSGSVQIGILLFKAGLKGESRRILEWARRVQSNHESGGLFQYADAEGNLDTHVHTEINSWGTKYFCQLERLWQDGG